MQLRPYQSEALQISKDKYEAGITRQLIQLPTGMGKTVLFANLRNHHDFKNRQLVLVHRDELAEQAAKHLSRWNPSLRVGVEMGDSRWSTNDDLVVAGVQTIGTENNKRLSNFKPSQFDSLTCDEAHHSPAVTYGRVFDYFGLLDGEKRDIHRLLLGVTATPNRGDGQGLGQRFDEIIYRYPLLDAIRDGWLANIRGYKIRTNTDLSGVHVRAGDFAVGELEEAVNVEERNHLIVQKWLTLGENRQTVAFCVDIAHAKRLAETFKGYGVAAEAIWGNDPDRKEKLANHKAKRIQVLTNCGVLTEGYDDWQIACIIMARPTRSQLLFVQMSGRGTRIPEGIDNLLIAREKGLTIDKEDCILLDVVDNTGRHSLVTLASLFGLGAQTDLKGKTVTFAKQKLDEVLAERPLFNVERVDDIDDLAAVVQTVDLFQVNWEPEVTANSSLRWIKTASGEYRMNMPSKETVTVYQDLLDKWGVKGSVMGNQFALDGMNDLQQAFNKADGFITSYGREWLKLLRREAKWHNHPASTAQKEFIKKLYKFEPPVLSRLETFTKEEARLLIDKKVHAAVGNPR